MSKYTTGELAKLCGVTVRTVQYYDTRTIKQPINPYYQPDHYKEKELA